MAQQGSCLYAAKTAKIWPSWKYAPGSDELQICKAQPSQDEVRAHITGLVESGDVEGFTTWECEFWVAHASWMLPKRREYNRRLADNKQSAALAFDAVYPHLDAEFVDWQ